MRRLTKGFVLLLTVSLLVTGLWAYAQSRAPRERIPVDISAQLRTEIEKLYSSDKKEQAEAFMKLRYMGMRGEAAPAIPFLVQMLVSRQKSFDG